MKNIKDGVQEVCEMLYREHGEIKPSALVEAARPKTSPAHNAFTWDDKLAGEQYRLQQARHWIRCVEIVVESSPCRMVHVPIVENGQIQEREGYYKPISVVGMSKFEYDAAIAECLAKLDAAKKTFDELDKLATNFSGEKRPRTKQANKGFRMVREAIPA